MIFNQEEVIKLCEELGIEVVEGNVPLMNGKPLSEDFKIFKEDEIIMKGRIITFEGLDGSFKETNAKKLHEYLTNKGIKCNLVSFPRYDNEASVFVRRFLYGEYGDLKKISPYTIMHFYALDRFDYIQKNNVYKKLEEGEWFIFDRYVESNIIYQSALYDTQIEKDLIIEDILELEYRQLSLPEPDITLAMYSDYDLVQNILDERVKKDIYESNNECLKKVFENYDVLINRFDWSRINVIRYDDIKDEYSFKSEEEIFNDIIKTLENKIL